MIVKQGSAPNGAETSVQQKRKARISMRRTIPITAALLALAVAAPVASAADYPLPDKPGTPQPKPSGKGKTFKVCPKLTKKSKKAGCKYTVVQQAVDAAKAGDTVKIADGTYGEGVIVAGANKRYLKIVGNVKSPQKVMFDMKKIPKKVKYKSKVKGGNAYNTQIQNAVAINSANEVTLNGLGARNFKGNGFFVVNNTGYTFDHLWAQNVGTYGIYAFNTIGGTMKNSEASYNNDAGFYIGQTPPQDKPIRTIVSNLKSWGNVLGWSGTNMKYVTIKDSDFYNNGAGIVPNALRSEKFAPPEFNTIINNRVFLNNFNYRKGKIPFLVQSSSTDGVPYPIGVGILLFGSQTTTVENNQIFGNYLLGFGALQQLLLSIDDQPVDKADPNGPKVKDMVEWYTLRGNKVINNKFGNGGANPNGRSIGYDGNGTDNCISGNDLDSEPTVPANQGTFVPCPFSGANVFDSAAQGEAVGWVASSDLEANWMKKPQAPVAGVTPLEHGTLR